MPPRVAEPSHLAAESLLRRARKCFELGKTEETVELCTRCLGVLWGWPEENTVAWRGLALENDLNAAASVMGRLSNPEHDCPWTFVSDVSPTSSSVDSADILRSKALALRAAAHAQPQLAIEDYSASLYYVRDEAIIEARGLTLASLGDSQRALRDASLLENRGQSEAAQRVFDAIVVAQPSWDAEAEALEALQARLPRSAAEVPGHASAARALAARLGGNFAAKCARRGISTSDDEKILARRAAFVETTATAGQAPTRGFHVGPVSIGPVATIVEVRSELDDATWHCAKCEVDQRAEAAMMIADGHRCAPDQFAQVIRDDLALSKTSPHLFEAVCLLRAVATEAALSSPVALQPPETAPIVLARYPPGATYAMHKDAYDPSAPRQLTLLLYIADIEADTHEEGGHLRIHSNVYPGGATDIAPRAGRVVIFHSKSTWHEVLPCSGPRRVLTLWLDAAKCESILGPPGDPEPSGFDTTPEARGATLAALPGCMPRTVLVRRSGTFCCHDTE